MPAFFASLGQFEQQVECRAGGVLNLRAAFVLSLTLAKGDSIGFVVPQMAGVPGGKGVKCQEAAPKPVRDIRPLSDNPSVSSRSSGFRPASPHSVYLPPDGRPLSARPLLCVLFLAVCPEYCVFCAASRAAVLSDAKFRAVPPQNPRPPSGHRDCGFVHPSRFQVSEQIEPTLFRFTIAFRYCQQMLLSRPVRTHHYQCTGAFRPRSPAFR